jgi:hypothetical protein
MVDARAAGKVLVENVNVPGYTHAVDAAHYEAMKKVLLKILPRSGPGLTQAEMWTQAAAVADRTLFPDRGKVGWWMKSVQLDLEAKGVIGRDTSAKPLRWRRLK